MATVFAATTEGKPGGYGVPNAIVAPRARRLESGEVSTGPCTTVGAQRQFRPVSYDR